MQQLVSNFKQIADNHLKKPSERVPIDNPATNLLRDFSNHLKAFSDDLPTSAPIISEIEICEPFGYRISSVSGSKRLENLSYPTDGPSSKTLTEIYIFFNDNMDKCYDVTLKDNKLIVRLRSHWRS